MNNIKPKSYLIINNTSDTSINHGIDPVTCQDITTIIRGSIQIVNSRKTLKGAINLRNKKYKNALIIEAY